MLLRPIFCYASLMAIGVWNFGGNIASAAPADGAVSLAGEWSIRLDPERTGIEGQVVCRRAAGGACRPMGPGTSARLDRREQAGHAQRSARRFQMA